MEYFFILGRNPALSYAEVLSYLNSQSIRYNVLLFKKNFLVVHIQEGARIDIQEFGGVIKSGEVSYSGSSAGLSEYIDDYFAEKQKFSFCVIGNASEKIEEQLKNKFKREGLKAFVRHGRKEIKLMGGDYMAMHNADVEFFYYLEESGKKAYFGAVDQTYSSSEIKERDMKKPFRRESLAISPRLAKILVNLSEVKKGGLLLDPFCGVGGIIQEALLKKINCYGIDKDKKAIDNAHDNLKWLAEHYDIHASYNLLNANARNLPNIKFEGIATEPELGRLKKRKLNDAEAKKFINQFEKMIIPILRKACQTKKQEARIVLTLPYIRDFSTNINRICEQTGLTICKIHGIQMPIKEFRDDQFVSREIVVLS